MTSITVFSSTPTPTSSTASIWRQSTRKLKFKEINDATRNFHDDYKIGKGGFGPVYRGTIYNGDVYVDAAIKRLDSKSEQGKEEFLAEVELLSDLKHINLVYLVGHCEHEHEMILVYDYMSNGSLKEHLYKQNTSLSWEKRLEIALGVARGLDYLHTGTAIRSGILHGDIKPSNILLHQNWTPKISDLGLSKKSPWQSLDFRGTHGYMDPDYLKSGILTCKSDVYAFGVVLLQLLFLKDAVLEDGTTRITLADWAKENIFKKREVNNELDPVYIYRVVDLIPKELDPVIRKQISATCLDGVIKIAEGCLDDNPMKRSTMAHVVDNLQTLHTLEQSKRESLQGPRRPILARLDHFVHRDSSQSCSSSRRSNTDSDTVPEDARIPDPRLKVFAFANLETATNNFGESMRLGHGGFGNTFLGYVDKNTFLPSLQGDGIAVAVNSRRKASSYQGHTDWLEEVTLLGELDHPNISRLLGYCNEENKYLLVSEHIHTRYYDDLLFINAKPLPWKGRLHIMTDVARGLNYLHSQNNQVLCGSVKSSDILLDQDLKAKLGEFGLVKFAPNVADTVAMTAATGHFAYIDPHYYATGQLTAKTDIYGFGVLFLETLAGIRAWDSSRAEGQRNLVSWAVPILMRGEINTIMDSRLNDYPAEAAQECAAVVLSCLKYEPKDRLSSEEILASLEQIYVINSLKDLNSK